MCKLSCVALSVLVLVLSSGLGCSRKPDDNKISSQIQAKYGQDSGLSSRQITVQSSGGVVTLSGNVENEAERAAAARQAAAVEGVKEVVNNLEIGNVTSASSRPSNARTKAAPSAAGHHSGDTRQSNPAAPEANSPGKTGSSNGESSAAAENPQPANASTSEQPAADPRTNASPVAATQPLRITIEQGAPVSVRLIDSIDSEKNQTGDTFHATLNSPLSAEGYEAIPAGTDVTGHIVEVKSASKFAGKPLVVLQLDSIHPQGRTYELQTDQYRKEGSSRGKSTAEKVGGGAIIGGIIGAIAGGGKGAAIGTAAGAGVGGGAQAASKSQPIKLPSETVLNFTLQAPLTVLKPQDSTGSRQRLGDSQ